MVLQLLAATDKTGELEVRTSDEQHRGFLGVSQGRLVSARSEDADGYLALGAVYAIEQGDFEFLPQDRIDRDDLSGDLESLLERAAEERDRVRAIREAIPNDHIRFKLSERATERGQITLEPAQWKALLLVDGQRDVAALAERLEMPRLDTQQLLAELVRAGLVDTVSAADGAAEPSRPYRRLPPMQPIPPTTSGERVVLRGRIPDFPLETIVQLLAETKKTGRLEVRAGRDASTLGMSDGRLVSAVSGEEEGELGLGAAFTGAEGDFVFVPMNAAPAANLAGELDPLLDRAAAMRDRIVAVRGLIPSERSRFTLSERATSRSEIVLTPEQWRVLLGVNGERDVHAIAEHLRMRRLPAMMVLADLVRGGYVDVLPEVVEPTWPQVERRRSAWSAPVAPAAAPPPIVEEPIVEEPIVEEIVEEPVVEEPVVEEPPAPVEPEAPLAETPADVEPADDRLAALTGLFGPPEPAPPPAAWEPPPAEVAPSEVSSAEAAAAAATAEAFAATPPPEAEPEIDPRLAAFGAPPPQPEAPAWEAPPAEPAAPTWETPSWETPTAAPAEPAPAEPEAQEIDPRLAAFGAAGAPAWEAPAEPATPPSTPLYIPPGPAPELPPLEMEAPATEAPPPIAPAPAPAAPIAAPPAEKKKGLFGGMFGGKQAAVAGPTITATTRPGQLATFANELVTGYNSGQYGRAKVEDRMLNLIMRVDEQADPIDRPIPVVNDRLDVASIDRDALPERQALPYLAVLVRQIYDDAERALGKDKARRGFREIRDRLFGADLTLLQAPEVGGRLPKV